MMRLYSICLSILVVLCFSIGIYAQSEWFVAPSEGNGFGKFSLWAKDIGQSSDILLVGDVTGDKKADAVMMNNASGAWYVAESKGKSFKDPEKIIDNYAVNSSYQMLGDVNGDGLDDVVTFYAENGDWYVALAKGKGKFEKHTLWLREHGIGGSKQFLGDVDGDKREDAVIFFPKQGLWFVSISKGDSFSTERIKYGDDWIKDHGIGSTAQFVADVTGDGKADSVVFFGQHGQWYIAPSTGKSFAPFNRWIDGHGIRSTAQFLSDVDGDGRADATVFFSEFGSWYSAKSNKNSFNTFSNWTEGHGINSTRQFLADVTGDGKDDAIVVFTR
jgi:hypothetical protein